VGCYGLVDSEQERIVQRSVADVCIERLRRFFGETLKNFNTALVLFYEGFFRCIIALI
jgi:hypothetical protein